MTQFRPTRLAVSLSVALLFGLATAAPAQEGMELPKPTKQHEMLKKDLGTWDATMKVWMGPGDPVESKGVETNTMLGDLWLITDYKGDFAGMPFEGHGQNGYDTTRNKYVSTWVDTFTTSAMLLDGTYDEKTGELTLVGETTDPASGTKIPMKNVSRHNDDGTRTMTMFMKNPAGDDWIKSMEIHYTPRKTDTK